MIIFQPLKSYEIEDLLESDAFTVDQFLGVYSSEKLPVVYRLPSAFIWNTDDSSRRGEHWVAVYFNSLGHACYFDPLGLPPLWQTWENYLRDNSNKGQWFYTTKTVQNPLSSTCGYHCILYVLYRCRGFSAQNVLKLYSSNLDENDVFVVDAVHKLLSPGVIN